ncbi:MAG: hypothetical protein GY850_30620 [bacterium]|nr:hypothetical protein [bacterium]
MPKTGSREEGGGCKGGECCSAAPVFLSQPTAVNIPNAEPCCGAPTGPPSNPDERPGYATCSFVDSFRNCPSGSVPKLKSRLGFSDLSGTVQARLGIFRDQYKVAPGLYCLGEPGPESPVLVTANYKLSFDTLRSRAGRLTAWLLVLDTRGVNVWCAAGKKTFSTDEIIRQVRRVGLEKVVKHRQLIVPQLGAPGVSAQKVREGCGFKVVWGPVRAEDLGYFLENDLKAESSMRQVTFSFWERLVLVPVEISLVIKPSLVIIAAMFFLSAISPDFSVAAAWQRGLHFALAFICGILAGAVAVPLFLPLLPGVSFFLKGLWPGLVFGGLALAVAENYTSPEAVAMMLICLSVGSYAAMNFTGATPYASPSGVEKEMRRGIPLQALMALAALALWLTGPFI